MNPSDYSELPSGDEADRPRVPHRKSVGPGRARKQKARRASRSKQAGESAAGIHRRGSKRRAT